MVKDIKIEDFDYNLPDERIPRHPLQQRDACKLILSRPDGGVAHRHFNELPSLLPPATLLVCNDTRVINARISFYKTTGSRIEIFLLEPIDPADYVLTFQSRGKCIWNCLVGNLKRWKEGALSIEIRAEGTTTPVTLSARRLNPTAGNAHAIEFTWDNPDVTFASVVDAAGFIPIPPYLKRESEECDNDDYQTVYADAKGSVAAPTAGLHFTPEVFDDLYAHNIEVGKLTLHVGAGTFQPVKSENIGDHPMHTESFSVNRDLIRRLIAQKQAGEPLAAVGTTSVRTLESLPYLGAAIARGDESMHVDQWEAYSAESSSIDTIEALTAIDRWLEKNNKTILTASTAIMIAPGFRWRMVDVMVTNFHQPQSTLLLLVSSFLGERNGLPVWRDLYDEALRNDYRFLSYGDACLLFAPTVAKRVSIDNTVDNTAEDTTDNNADNASDATDTIILPVSKSIGARYLAASYFAGTLPTCPALTDCDDLRVIQRALLALFDMKETGKISGESIDIHASGTAFRFVTAIAASTPGTDCIITGTPRLCSRPMAPMLDVLRKAGAQIESLGENGTGPYRIHGSALKGGEFEIKGDVSSQFISALMLCAPTWENGMSLRFTTPLVSRPYAEMTAQVMRQFGMEVTLHDEGVEVKAGRYVAPARFKVEADWSAAGFFYEAAALSNAKIRIAALVSPSESLQGDAATAGFFEMAGVESTFDDNGATLSEGEEKPDRIEVDLTDNPDLAPAFAVACALSDCEFRFDGVRNLRLKECDRLAAIQTELRKLGYVITVTDDSIEWNGKRCDTTPEAIATYDDHRIAMAFAMAALRLGEIKIADPDVVNKSFEDFWNQLPKIGLHCQRNGNVIILKRVQK